jgi:hypothetical protein
MPQDQAPSKSVDAQLTLSEHECHCSGSMWTAWLRVAVAGLEQAQAAADAAALLTPPRGSHTPYHPISPIDQSRGHPEELE